MTGRRTVLEVAGLVVDAETRTIFAHGTRLPVTAVQYCAASPETTGAERWATPHGRAVIELIYRTPERIAAAIERTSPAMPESLHFNLPCENGWWIEVAVYPELDGLCFLLPGESVADERYGDAADLLALWEEVARRPAYVAPLDFELIVEDPWAGAAPGAWFGVKDFGPLEEE